MNQDFFYTMITKRFAFISLAFLFSSCYMVRAYKYRHLKLEDLDKMPSVIVEKGNAPNPFIEGSSQSEFKILATHLDSVLANTHTAAFLIVRHDSIIYENYFNGFTKESLLPSFSVSKSFVGTLTGIAIEEGILSLYDPITKYIPELIKNDSRFNKITIEQLLNMRSGIHFNEGTYNLKDDAIKLGFRLNIEKQIKKLKIERPSGGPFNYQSINTLLLAVAIERASKESLSSYLSDKIWKPAGMEYNASWTVDSKHHLQEIGYAGLNATARDFAKLGQLYNNNGFLNGQQIVSSDWINNTISPDSMYKYDGYHNQFWGVTRYQNFIDSAAGIEYKGSHPLAGALLPYLNKENEKKFFIKYHSPEFYAKGILGEVVYGNPKKNLVIVRLGHYWNHKISLNRFIKELASEL